MAKRYVYKPMSNDLEKKASNFLSYWLAGVAILGAIAACFKFYFTVTTLAATQADWQKTSEQRRETQRNEMEAVRTRVAVNETIIDCMRHKNCQ